MATLDLATIPSNINTYERLLIWAAQCMQDLAGSQGVIPVAGEAEIPKCSVSTAPLANSLPHFIVQAYVPVDLGELNSPTEKTWMAAQDLSSATPHTNLLSN